MNVWDDEPDEHHFQAYALQCLMVRNEWTKTWCGYVGVPASHPLYGTNLRDRVPYPESWRERPIVVNDHGIINLFTALFDADEIPDSHAPLTMVLVCHGGLSFSDRIRTWTGWWFGFDCNHAGDYAPGSVEALRACAVNMPEGPQALLSWMQHRDYRTFEYVKSECANLACQISEYGAAPEARDLLKAITGNG